MKISPFAFCSIFTLIVCMCIPQANAQLQERPIQKSSKQTFRLSNMQMDTVTTNFPFWDDFSLSDQYPDENLWLNSKNVQISSDISINPPTYKVASLNGVDSLGFPHNNSSQNAITDVLTSQLIDLSSMRVADNVFLSFFWQFKGHGEIPEEGDRLEVQFKDENGDWQLVWSKEGSISIDASEFEQVLLKLDNFTYFHKAFQFRFRTYGRQSGVFDNWNIDYVYLDKNRSADDVYYKDRALTIRPSSIFTNYYSVPIVHFLGNPAFYTNIPQAEINNLGTTPVPQSFTAILKDLYDGTTDTLNNSTDFSSLIGALERRKFNLAPIDPSALDVSESEEGQIPERQLELILYLDKSGDNFLESNGQFHNHISLKANDTIRSKYNLSDFYSYDDGTSETSAGIGQKNGKLAYEYTITGGDYLTHIDINFPPGIPDLSGVPIELMVWKTLDNDTEPIYTQSAIVQSNGQDSLYSYKLNRKVWVEGTFYIGYRQTTDEVLLVGLDKNTNSADRMFYNIGEAWQANEKVEGSFLMRARFSQEADDIKSAEDQLEKDIQLPLFPNPSNGLFFVQGKFNAIRVFNAQGMLIQEVFWQSQETHTIDLSGEPSGMYLLWVNKPQGSYTQRIVLKK